MNAPLLPGQPAPVSAPTAASTAPVAAVTGAVTAANTAALHKAALGWTHTARFLTTAAQLDQLPPTELPEIAFVGRSNAGKSTAINTLAQAVPSG